MGAVRGYQKYPTHDGRVLSGVIVCRLSVKVKLPNQLRPGGSQMLTLEYSREALEALRYWRFHHPHPLVQLKMEVVLVRSQVVLNEQIQHICGISKATLYRYLHEYQEGGVERLKALHGNRQESALIHQRTTLEEHFRAQSPATVAAAAAQIEALTGIKRSLIQTRQFLQK
jgi:transposase